jgi:retron-type reverse transcriptase
MKRIGFLYEKIISKENLLLADEKARKGKRQNYGVLKHDASRESNISALHQMLKNKCFKTSPYHVFTITEPKEREIYRLPYYPDRIVHHAIMNILEPIWTSTFTKNTYSCIKRRGIHGALRQVKSDMRDIEGTKYCLKMDIKKYYPNIDHEILKSIIRKKIKDNDLLQLIDEIIDSTPGVPIGNYLSQYFANLYLSYFDHYVKEVLKVKYYYRYADDLVFLASSKKHLHQVFGQASNYLNNELKLTVKSNYQVYPVDARSLDFVGYRFYHTHILLRKSIKKRFARAMKKNPGNNKIHSAYFGWAKHCNSFNLLNKLTQNEKV